ncbi:MAG: formylglycine-generating enzyme family protein [Anaerolineae bacterium]|nr:formylglycine-generating enzyme family protein [Anaerolineae bacterium]
MTRQNYGTLRNNRRGGGGSGAWQWTVIGFVIGFGCAAIAGLGLVIAGATGVIDMSGVLAANRPTQTPFVITNTAPPATPTLPPTEVLILPTDTPQQAAVLVPTASPTPDPSSIQVAPSATPTTEIVPTTEPQTAGDQTSQGIQQPAGANTIEIPRLLEGKLTALRQVDGGTFNMGTTPQEVAIAVDECTNFYEGTCQLSYGEDSAPPHSVTVSPFNMEVTEVTYDQYMAFLNSMGPNSHRTGCDGQLCIATRAEDENSNVIFDSANYRVNNAILNYPVAGVTWYGAQSYCEAIGRRLPTEAEWERAARAVVQGTEMTLYPWGNTFDVSLARTSRPREENLALVGAKPIGSYAAGAWSLFDMSGNVAEWVSDWYSPTFYSQQLQSGSAIVDPTGPVAGTQKVVRGGSWDTVPFFARSVHRQSFEPQDQKLFIGFRCAAPISSPVVPLTNTGTDLTAVTPGTDTGANEEDTSSSQPTIPAPPLQPTSSGPVATLNPSG